MNMIKSGTRLYINITNHCNTNCPFCCMYSGTDKSTYMDFESFKNIIDECEGEFELQLEGGEPLTAPLLYLFMEYAYSTGRSKKIIILTNGIELEKHLVRLTDFSEFYQINIELKISINYWLISQVENFMHKMDMIDFATKDLQFLKVIFNVRKRSTGDEYIEELLQKYGLTGNSNVFYLQSYGKLSDSDYEKPVIVQNIDNWRIYSCDGECFYQDLIARSEHERELP